MMNSKSFAAQQTQHSTDGVLLWGFSDLHLVLRGIFSGPHACGFSLLPNK